MWDIRKFINTTLLWNLIVDDDSEEWDLNPIRSRWPARRRRPELISFTLTRRVNQRPKSSTKGQNCQPETKVVNQRPKGILVNIVIWKTVTFNEIYWSCHGTARGIALHNSNFGISTVSMCDYLEQCIQSLSFSTLSLSCRSQTHQLPT